MLRPQEISDGRGKKFAGAMTSVVGVAAISILAFAMPDLGRPPEFREIDVSRWTEIPVLEIPETEETVEETEEAEEAVEETEQRQRRDISDLPSASSDLSALLDTPARRRAELGGGSSNNVKRLDDFANPEDLGGYRTLQGRESPLAQSERGLGAGLNGGGGLDLDIGDGSNLGPGGPLGLGEGSGAGTDGLGGPEGREDASAGKKLELGLRNTSDLPGDYSDSDLNKMCKWAQDNPVELERGLQEYLTDFNWDDSYSSSRRELEITRDGQRERYEIYVACLPEKGEYHVMLVDEANKATYLSDRGKRMPGAFERGSVERRSPDSMPEGMTGRKLALNDPMVQDFLRIFHTLLAEVVE